jgi:XTP/dITP diphosphohydrolase
VTALGGAPGVHSARFAQAAGGPKSDAANNARLIAELAGHADRRAYYYCVLVLMRHADDPEPLIAEGRWRGEIVDAPRGENGFGYDPHFFIPALGASAAELEPAVKNSHSHRALALRALLALLGELA